MAGHNKWSQIKHKKAKTDAQKGKAFSKAGREILMAVKMGGGPDPDKNAALRLAIQNAKNVNMPNDTIKRAIERAAGDANSDHYDEVIYEAYGPFGVAILIRVLTDNKNRTVPNLRTILGKSGGNLANSGSVSYLFEKKGVLIFDSSVTEDQLFEVADLAEDIQALDEGGFEVLTSVPDFESIKRACDEGKLLYEKASLDMCPKTVVKIEGEQVDKILQLIDKLEDDDDVQEVSVNAEFD